jgi:glycosyltransferase involved in cell wall biosynthesis
MAPCWAGFVYARDIKNSSGSCGGGLPAAEMRDCHVHSRPVQRDCGRKPDTHCFVVPVNDVEGGYDYPECVRFEIEEQDLSSYQRAAHFLNISNVDVVSLQHEFGIFGGNCGSNVLALLRELKMPVVTTLHTILREPSTKQRRVMQEVIAHSTRVVSMTQKGSEFLQQVYDVPVEKIDLIRTGIPDMPFVDPNYYKDKFGVEGKLVLLTFGLLSPNKGIESVLNALPEIVKEYPNLVYIVLGRRTRTWCASREKRTGSAWND